MAKKKKPVVKKDNVEVEDVVIEDAVTVEIAEDASIDEGSLAPELAEIDQIDAESEVLSDVSEDVAEPDPTMLSPEPQKSRAVPLILGGVIAAILGFSAARSNVVDDFLPPSWRMDAGEIALQDQISLSQAEIDDLNKKLSDLADQLENVPAAETDPEIVTQIQDLTARVDAVEDRPVATNGNVPDFSEDFTALRNVAKQQQDEIDALLADARLAEQTSQEAASNTLARAAVTRIVTAIESGATFAAALGDLEATGVSDIPDVLREVAGDGVVTLASLQDMVPEAARAALAASPANADAGFGGFLKRQLGARSMAPREGDDPDAILSRLEGATRQGRLTDALAEAETLPQEAKTAMSDWIENATTRLAVTSASETLIQRLSAN